MPTNGGHGHEPRFVPGQMGRRMVSIAALVERVETAFIDEHGTDSPAIREADTPGKRLKLVLATTNYVFAVESIQLSDIERADVIRRVYSNLFGYGPLDALFLDDRITTISLDGANLAAVRHGHAELTSLGTIFQDEAQFRRALKRLLMDAGAQLQDDQPYIEAGLMIDERPVCINLIAPPVTPEYHVDIRVHPKALPTPENLIEQGFWTAQAADFLKAVVESAQGFMVVGEPESGKTTLLSVLAQWLPPSQAIVSVERAGELRLLPGVQRFTVKWPVDDQPGLTFGEQISRALESRPACLLLDEVRSDEPLTIAPLLQLPDAPRQIWSFRGPIFDKRLQSALGMLARRADMSQGEDMVRALYQRLAFVMTVSNLNGVLRLWSVGEWQFKHSPDYPTYVSLMRVESGKLRLTGERPDRELALSETFWK